MSVLFDLLLLITPKGIKVADWPFKASLLEASWTSPELEKDCYFLGPIITVDTQVGQVMENLFIK